MIARASRLTEKRLAAHLITCGSCMYEWRDVVTSVVGFDVETIGQTVKRLNQFFLC